MPPSSAITVPGVDLGDPAFWSAPLDERAAAFAALQDQCPVSFHPEVMTFDALPAGPGFWSIVRHEDLRMVSRKTSVFSSAAGITLGEQAPETLEFFGSMIVLDDPRHAKLRLLVQKGFTPKMVAKVDQNVRVRARRLIAEAAELGECDFVDRFAAPLPLQIICDMLGVPAADERQILDWTNVILGIGDPDFGATLETLIESALGMYNYAQALGQDRLEHPREDITSELMHAEVEGQRLSPAEFGSFFILLAVAGNETTRNAISWGAKLLTDHPDQRTEFMADVAGLMPNAVEEIVRWSSPVIHMRRTALADTHIGDQAIAEGDKVVLWYWAGNRDPRVFPDGHRFDLRRANAKEQVGFGSGGPHFCLGANLARREISVMFDELFRWLPDLEVTSEPARLQSAFINGVKRMRCEFTPRSVPLDLDT